MQTIEFETQIDENGHIYLPQQYKNIYGKKARFVVLIKEPSQPLRKAGSARGILQVISEDDEHLNDFKDYL
jgi:DNA-binding transcriptional regulator/RsmH inhibitor MraZ